LAVKVVVLGHIPTRGCFFLRLPLVLHVVSAASPQRSERGPSPSDGTCTPSPAAPARTPPRPHKPRCTAATPLPLPGTPARTPPALTRRRRQTHLRRRDAPPRAERRVPRHRERHCGVVARPVVHPHLVAPLLLGGGVKTVAVPKTLRVLKTRRVSVR
jgi:hypothetical protein